MHRLRPSRAGRTQRLYRPRFEAVERRELLATFVVSNVGDNGGVDPTPGAGTGTLRQAIVDANAAPDLDQIVFALPVGVPTVIRPLSSLPAITAPVVVDGRSASNPSTPAVTLDGSTAGFADGLTVFPGGDGSTIEGLVIVNFAGNGISILFADQVTVRDNFIGTDLTGSSSVGNGGDGVQIDGTGNVVGGPTTSERNVISGNGGNGVTVFSGTNQILSNIIGVSDAPFDQPPISFRLVPNRSNGVDIEADAFGTVVGAPSSGNLIAGNLGFGIAVFNAIGTVVQGNAVGTTFFNATQSGIGNATGNIGNNLDGISLSNASGTLIGGTAAGAGNTISGNFRSGIRITGNAPGAPSPGNTIQGNRVGTDISGTARFPNQASGIVISNSESNVIGGTAGSAAANLISANVGSGVVLSGLATNGTAISGNLIGLDATGTRALGNSGDGVTLAAGPRNTRIGGSGSGGNVISANGGSGINVLLTSAGTTILGNSVGLSTAGAVLGNGGDGVFLGGAGNTVGGTSPGDRNVISGNQGNGININVPGSTAAVNQILGNYIGLGPDGRSQGQGNQQDGILVQSTAVTVIGGTSSGAGNVVSGNKQSGIHLAGASTSQTVQGNLVGLNADGSFASPGNLLDGIFLDGVSGNLVGGTDPGAGNVVSGNGASGIHVLAGTNGLIQGNRVGTDPTGTAARGNSQRGILLEAASGVTVGGLASGSENLVSGNESSGIVVQGVSSSTTVVGGNNLILGNRVGTDVTGLSALGNGQNGVEINDSPGNSVGGTSPAAINVISANGLSGVMITGSRSTSNVVQGNRIGTDSLGQAPLGNDKDGVLLMGTAGNQVGGDALNAGNLISGNSGNGLELRDNGTSGNTIAGNLVGTDVTGKKRLANAQNGVFFAAGAVGNTLGGTTSGSMNLISGNGANGVSIVQGASGVSILGNLIGTDVTGTLGLGNSTAGVSISNSAGNQIGGGQAGARNLISGNLSSGLVLFGSLATGNRVQGNLVGTDVSGTSPLGNSAAGLLIDGAPGNLVGGSLSANEGNVISGNSAVGVGISGGDASGNRIAGNRIGTDATGLVRIGNAFDGVLLNGAPGNVVGGTTDQRNVISGNGANGINAVNIASPAGPGVQILGNLIGTDATGLRRLGNLFDGVLLNGVEKALVGAAGQPNVIAANGRNGIESALGSRGGVIQANLIGTDPGGTFALGNGLDGVLLANTSTTLVGGSAAGLGNLISGNSLNGIHIVGGTAARNFVQGNRVGTGASGTTRLGNLGDGILVESSALNLIGGVGAAEGNLFSANGGDGIAISGGGSNGNVIYQNTVGTNVSGISALGNLGYGVSIEGARGNQFVRGLVSGNGIGGVQISGIAATGNVINQSSIGTNRSGTAAIGNGIGLFINGAPGNLVLNSLISGNTSSGIYLFGRFAAGNVIQGNRIGTDSSGLRTFRTSAGLVQQVGVLIVQAPGLNLASQPAAGNRIGGPGAAARNIISGNVTGVALVSGDSRGNTIAGNYIGIGTDGQTAVPNGVGIYFNSAPGNVVGGAAGNVISGNTSVGVYLLGTGASGNTITGNRIGLNAAGTKAVPNQYGVYAENAPQNRIGGTTAAARNVISGNSVAGVYFVNTQTGGNVVQGNWIGTDAANRGVIPNLQYGVLLVNAVNNTVVRSGPNANIIVGSGIANFREFTGRLNSTGGTTPTRAVHTQPASRTPAAPSASLAVRKLARRKSV